MAARKIPFVTPEEYLRIEREAPFKSEYLSGEMLAMAGATREHNLIVINIGGEIRSQLKGHPCETYPSDMKVESGPAGLYTYPDVTVVCGEPRFHDDHTDVLLNPTVIFEVLSPSTEAYDRGAKFAHYRRIESLTDYILVSSADYCIEHYTRRPDNQWLLEDIVDIESSLTIDSIGCSLPLVEIYDRITFDDGAELRPGL